MTTENALEKAGLISKLRALAEAWNAEVDKCKCPGDKKAG
jgi:hypothetical protein